MKTLFLVAADAVVILHLLWIVFLILGALPGRRWAWVKWMHIASLAFSVALQVFSWICPLTYLEIWLRTLGGAQPYEGTFIRHYVEQIVYAEIPRVALLIGTLVVVVFSAWMYFTPKHKN
jgi:hypothetical protein